MVSVAVSASTSLAFSVIAGPPDPPPPPPPRGDFSASAVNDVPVDVSSAEQLPSLYALNV